VGNGIQPWSGSHPFIVLDKVKHRADLHPETSCALRLVENFSVTTGYRHFWKIDLKSAKMWREARAVRLAARTYNFVAPALLLKWKFQSGRSDRTASSTLALTFSRRLFLCKNIMLIQNSASSICYFYITIVGKDCCCRGRRPQLGEPFYSESSATLRTNYNTRLLNQACVKLIKMSASDHNGGRAVRRGGLA
jgi:hypothetical protein